MKNLSLRIVWSSDALHYVFGHGLKNDLPVLVAIQLQSLLKKSIMVADGSDHRWFKQLEGEMAEEVKTIYLN